MAAPVKEFSIINVGSYSIKALRCSIQDKKLKIIGWKTHRCELALTTQSPFADYVLELEKALNLFKQTVLQGIADVHFLFSASFLISKILGVPEFARTDLKVVLQDKLERDNAISSKPNGLKDFEYTTMLFDGLKEDDKIEEQMDMAAFVCLAEKTVVEGIQRFADQHRLRVRGVWAEPVAMAGLISRCDPQAWGEQIAVVNLGHTLTTFQIFSEGKCLFYRPIFTAGQQITKDVLSITNDETIDMKQAEELKHKMTLNPSGVDVAQLTPLEALIYNISEQAVLKEFSLVRKLDITFEYLPINIKKRINRVIYTGGTSNLTGLLDYISKNTTLPKGEVLDLNARVQRDAEWPEVEGEQAFPAYASCIGLAYALDAELYKNLNLSQAPSAFQLLSPDKLKEALTRNAKKVAIGVEALAAVAVLGYYGTTYTSNSTEIDSLEAKARVALATPANLGDVTAADEELEKIKKDTHDTKQKLEFYAATLKARTNWVGVFEGLAAALPEQDLALSSVTTRYKEKVAQVVKKKAASEDGESGEEAPTPAASAAATPTAPSIDRLEGELIVRGVALDLKSVVAYKNAVEKAGAFASVTLEKMTSDAKANEEGAQAAGLAVAGGDGDGDATVSQAAQDKRTFFTLRLGMH